MCPCLGEGGERSHSPCVLVGGEGCYQLTSSQCPCVKSGCTWDNMQLVWGFWSVWSGWWGSILCTYSVEIYSWSHELCLERIRSWSGLRSRGILKGHEHYI